MPSQPENIEINNMQLIEDIEKIEISSGNAGSTTPSIKSDSVKSDDEEMFSHRSPISDCRRQICPSSGADVSADGEGFDNEADVTETKRRKSKIELDRIRQLGEKQKIKEKSREREKPTDPAKDAKDQKSKIPKREIPPSQRNSKNSKPSKNGSRTKNDPKSKKGSKSKNEKPSRSKRK